ncbi:MAG TPA: wax ester/triacylglycerol synthase domain-containing protein [Acidimicrobiales bacterium]|nr:wax ester/triacylglycerol synthase domain-containing protein [Acidimicrobiales bacterium]
MDQRPFPRRLSASDSLMWRIDSDPVLRSPILVVGLLDRSPTPDGLAGTIERAGTLLPRLRQRIEPPPLGLGRPRWRDDDQASLAQHLRRCRAPGGDIDAVLTVAEPDAAAAFDPARPPWTLTVVDGLDRGRSAVVLRFHHAITDGVGAVEVAERLFDRARRPARAAPSSPTTAPVPGPSVLGGWHDPRRLLASGADTARRALAAAVHPAPTLAAAARLGRSAARLLTPATAGGSPELAGRSLDRWLAVTERPLAALQRAADATGGTVNDVLLAAVAGALAAYHRTHGRPVPAVRVTMPISIRRPDDPMGGNRFVPARFTLPVDDPDPRARVKIAGAIVRGWRAEPALASTDLLAAGLNLLPRPLVARLFAGMLRSIDVDVVDVPGLDHPAFLGGARIERLWAFAPPTGAALSVTLLSHAGTCGIGLACDRRAVADPELLATCLDAALAEVLALGREPHATARSGAIRRSA